MEMREKSLIRFLSLTKIGAFAFVLLIFVSCNPEEGKTETVLKIANGNLIFEVNGNLHTRFFSTLQDTKPILDGFQPSESLLIDGLPIKAFNFDALKEKTLEGNLPGKQWILEGTYHDHNLALGKRLILTTYDAFPDLIATQVVYTNNSDHDLFVEKWINNNYTLLSQGDRPPFWAFQGSSSSSRSDWIKPIESGYYQKNFMGMNATDYGGGIPVTAVWRPDINIAIGHLALVPKLVTLPTEIPARENNVQISVAKEFPERTVFKSKDSIATLDTFLSISKGDYFENLSKYATLMKAKGIKFVDPEPAAFEPIWCAWGYGRTFTLDEVINTLPKVKELGIKWAVLDDGFQIAEGDWDANPKKFPKGNSEIKDLVDKIHANGLKAKIWWTPLAADPQSKVLTEHPDMRVFQKDESPQFITWWDAYYLSPAKEITKDYTKGTIQHFIKDLGFDGLKMDGQHMNAVAPDYSLDNPEDAPEELPAFFQMIYDETRMIKPHAVVENCPCGTCMSFYNMASMNQAVASDPLSSWQIRLKGKTYKAIIPNIAYYGDHVELSDNKDDFASSFGIGAVLGTKFTWPKDNADSREKLLLTPENEKIWKKWFSLYNEKMLSTGEYLGGVYDIGYDRPETHLIRKNGILYYAFYADKWDGKIRLKGLDKDKTYHVRDYFNDVDLGIISGNNPSLQVAFSNFLLISVNEPK
jgi:alpha-galactosidase